MNADMIALQVDDQIKLSQVRLRDLDVHYRLLDVNRSHIGLWETWVDKATYESQREYIRITTEGYQRGHGFTCGVWWRPDMQTEHTLVGNASYRITSSTRSVELGYWLGIDFTGQGIITRAARTLADYALMTDNKHRVVIQTAADNVKSRAVAERLNFQLDGIIRQEMVIRGQLFDRAIYTILATEWNSRG